MLNFLVVFIGGGLGSAVRYSVTLLFPVHKSMSTFTVNVVGCFLIAVVDSLLKKYNFNYIIASPYTRFLFITGFLGGFTTYSSFALDTFNHFSNNEIGMGAVYVASTFILGFCAFMVGIYFAKLF